tara:strand:+ start:10191 stop:11132 length:942 start_codon:yes stop_codon:yes gene_type:complete
MARPKKNNVEYFPHTVSHGKKMSYIEKKYKNDGYAVWFKLLEELGDAQDHYLDLNDDIQIMFLSDRCMVSEETLINIIQDLIKLKEFDQELWENYKVLFNEKFTESIADAYKKRNNNCITLKKLKESLSSLSNPKPSLSNPKPQFTELKGGRNTQSKVKKSKVKESKEDLIEKKEEAHEEISRGVFYEISVLKNHYLNSQKIVKAVLENETFKFQNIEHLKSRLEQFSNHLVENGEHSKSWFGQEGFPSHFKHWHLKTKEIQVKKALTEKNYKFAWDGQPPRWGTEQEYLGFKKNYEQFNFKTIKSPKTENAY